MKKENSPLKEGNNLEGVSNPLPNEELKTPCLKVKVSPNLMDNRLFLFAGEKSGDLLGGHLLKSLKAKLPWYKMEGVGGQQMRSQDFGCVMRTEEFEIVGFSEILKSLLKLRRQFGTIRDHILEQKPNGVVFIDYPGFNIRMAKTLRAHGYKGKLIQYISPTVWAWGKGRAKQMAETLDLLMTIYPFETKYFEDTTLQVKYIGNPIKEIISKHEYNNDWATLFGIKEKENLVAIFPGSRKAEVQLNLPIQLKAAELLKKESPNTRFVVSCAHEKIMPVMHGILRYNSLKLNQDIYLVPKSYSYELMRDCKSAIAKSGTVTLELALHHRPTVVIYKLTALNRLLAKYWLRLNLPHYCIVNILQKKMVFPELIEKGLNPQNLFHEIQTLHHETKERQQCIDNCKELNHTLQDYETSELAAKAIEEILHENI